MAVGAIIGTIAGILGLGISIFDFFSNNSVQEEQTRIQEEELERQREQDRIANQAALNETHQRIRETEGKMSEYEKFLGNIPIAGAELTGSTGDLEFDKAYRSLLENYGNLNVIAGATGRVAAGSTMAMVGGKAKQDITDLVGLTTDRYEQQLDILGESLEGYKDTERLLEESLGLRLPSPPTNTDPNLPENTKPKGLGGG